MNRPFDRVARNPLAAATCVPLLIGLLGLGSPALAIHYTYDPQANFPDNDLQYLCNLCSDVASIHTGIVLLGDWDGDLTITNERTSNWTLEAGDYRVARYLDILDSTVPSGPEGKLRFHGGWIGLDPAYGEIQAGATADIGAANVEFDGVLFRGQDVLTQVGQGCERTGHGALIELEGHATTTTGDNNSPLFAGVVNGSVDFIDCAFDFRFSALTPCQPEEGFLLNAIQAEDAKLRIRNPILPENSNLRFQNGFIEADASLVHLVSANLVDLEIVPGGTVTHPAPALVASGTLLDSANDPLGTRQIVISQSHFAGCSGGEAGAIWIQDAAVTGDYAGVLVAGPGSFSDCVGSETGALHIAGSMTAGVSAHEFSGNGNTNTAGHSAALTLDQVTGVQPAVEECQFLDNLSAGTGVAGALAVYDSPLRLSDCEFLGNNDRPAWIRNTSSRALTLESLVFDGTGALSHSDGPSLSTTSHTTCVVRNLLSLGYTRAMELTLADGGGTTELLLDGVTLVSSSTGLGVVSCVAPLLIKNGNLVCVTGITIPDGDSSNLTLSHVNADGCSAVVAGANSQHTVDHLTQYTSSFVGTGTPEEAYQLRWDSPLLDIGTGTGTGSQELLDYDFDYTTRDIGFKRRFPVTALSGSTSIDQIGWYTVAQNTSATVTYQSPLPHGSVFRVDPGAELEFSGSGSGTVHFGDANGERTMVVPRDQSNENFAETVRFRNADGEVLSFHGTKFNGLPDQLEFENCTVELNRNSGVQTVKLDPGTALDHELEFSFTDCAGSVSNYDFRRQAATDLWMRLFSTLRSSVSVHNCQFSATHQNEDYTLVMEGKKAGVATLISDCTFDGSSSTGVPIRLLDSQPHLERNLVDGVRYLALSSYLGAFTMDHTARNRFKSEYLVDPPVLSRLVYLHDSPVYLECGENSFTYNQIEIEPTFDYIFYKGKEPFQAIGQPDWKQYRLNFWGRDCSYPVAAAGRIPSWAIAGDELPVCPVGNPLVCGSIITGMLSQAQTLEESGDYSGAVAIYEDLIVGYPESPEALSAAQRLKAIAMASEVERSPADLYALADAVEYSESIVPAYLTGAAECLRAWQGDRPSAETNLQAQLAAADDESESAVAAKNLLEITTYPASGGLSRHARTDTRVLRDARRALLAFDSEVYSTSGSSGSIGRPGSLELHPA